MNDSSAIRANGSGPNRPSVSQNCQPKSASQASAHGRRVFPEAVPSADVARNSSIGGHRTSPVLGGQTELQQTGLRPFLDRLTPPVRMEHVRSRDRLTSHRPCTKV